MKTLLEQHAPKAEQARKIFRARTEPYPIWVLIIHAFMGLGWLRASVAKVVSLDWWSGAYLTNFLGEHEEAAVPFYGAIVDTVISPFVVVVALVVLLTQSAIGIAILSGHRVGAALGVGMFLNLNFIAVGAVNPSVFYVLAQGAVLLWMAEQDGIADCLVVRAVGWSSALLTLASLPFVNSLSPSGVIEDPALMLVTVGMLSSLACWEVLRRSADEAAATEHIAEPYLVATQALDQV